MAQRLGTTTSTNKQLNVNMRYWNTFSLHTLGDVAPLLYLIVHWLLYKMSTRHCFLWHLNSFNNFKLSMINLPLLHHMHSIKIWISNIVWEHLGTTLMIYKKLTCRGILLFFINAILRLWRTFSTFATILNKKYYIIHYDTLYFVYNRNGMSLSS